MRITDGESSRLRFLTVSFVSFVLLSACEKAPELEPWQPGYFDIHHISVASDSSLMVFPDGTPLLFDAGRSDRTGFEFGKLPGRNAKIRPRDRKRPGEWYARYVRDVLDAAGLEPKIDYALISHFDLDHYGRVTRNGSASNTPYDWVVASVPSMP